MTTDELRAKFEAWYAENTFDYPSNPIGSRECGLQWKAYQAAHTSRDVEVEALQDALFQISVRLKAERESDMDDMSWHTDMIARAQCLANQCQRIESAPIIDGFSYWPEYPKLSGKRVRLVVEDGE